MGLLSICDSFLAGHLILNLAVFIQTLHCSQYSSKKILLCPGSFMISTPSQLRLNLALAGVTQWIECQPVNQRVTSLRPMPGLQARSPVGAAQEATTH